LVGREQPRVDIPAKAFGEAVFVHDLRLPGMLHGRVVRPPYAGADHGEFIGNTLDSVDEASVAHIAGLRRVVVLRDFVGLVAEREDEAERAATELRVRWKSWPGMPPLADLEQALRDQPATERRLVDEGEVDAALAGADQALAARYVWPYQLHASIGPSCALAQWHGEQARPHVLTVWAATQYPHALRADLALLMGVAETAVEVIRLEGAGCYGRNCADDVAADAALLARTSGAAVRVQLTREQEHLWEPKGAAQLMELRGGLDEDGSIAAYDFSSCYPSNAARTLALLLTRTIEPLAPTYEMGDRTARPPYATQNLRVGVRDMPPILRAAWLRGVSALPNCFAHESFVDELAAAARQDPVDFRLRHLEDDRARELLRGTAERAGWRPHAGPRLQQGVGDWLQGQGVAYARYLHGRWPGFGAAYSAWVADVDVHRVTGEVKVRKVVVGHDAGLVINPAGARHQIHGNVIQTTSRALKESLRIDATTHLPAAREWGGYPILSFREVPVIEVWQAPRAHEPPLGVGESSSVPGTAAIANAIFDATGVRLREPPFTPEVVRAALQARGIGASSGTAATPGPADPPPAAAPGPQGPRGKRWWAAAGAAAVALVGLGASALGWRPAIAPVLRGSAAPLYTAELIEQGRRLAEAGGCAGCHTLPGGPALAGGLAMQTPFGTVHTTNLTPDADTGIGNWSFSAFQRAMREGVSRDGHLLYPAFPYTAYTRLTDDDLTALYAYLMSRPAVRSETPEARMRFPFNLRPLLGLWNALYLKPGPSQPAGAHHSAQWQRGAYLVEGLGHCGACHTPRNALGAEQSGSQHLAGARIRDLDAPALNTASRSPVPWTEAELFHYLRHGYSREHGAAMGAMAPVIGELQALPDADLRAMAHYLASFAGDADPGRAATAARAAVAAGQAAAPALLGPSQRLFEQACGACHHDGDGPRVLGVNVPLALSSALHADTPQRLLRTIAEGLQQPAGRDIGFMPGFAQALDDEQLAGLAAYLRSRFAPGKPPWSQLDLAAASAREAAAHNALR
ncbi:MAG: molybdopterin-dependent oxidoreductase, partial [Burkholderiales bacterium]|nr:molybdopterin-dependent oxidoreductase [Burkholderiales bacterium]